MVEETFNLPQGVAGIIGIDIEAKCQMSKLKVQMKSKFQISNEERKNSLTFGF
jgi:hypothetical protein